MDNQCSICKKDLGSTGVVVVREKGRTALTDASIQRGDNLQHELNSASEISVHIECRKNYTRSSSINSIKRRSTSGLLEDELHMQLRSESSAFDFKQHCLFCSDIINVKTKTAIKSRKYVSRVETIEINQSIYNQALYRHDTLGDDVLERITNVKDLVCAEARYHRDCFARFFSNRDEKNTSVGRPVDSEKDIAFQKLCIFLDESEECQYSITELLNHMNSNLHVDGKDGYGVQYLKMKLKEHYGENVIITSIDGKESIVSFRNASHRILREKWVYDNIADADNHKDIIIEMAASLILNDIRTRVYDTEECPTLSQTENGSTLVPDSLNHFLHCLLDQKGKSSPTINRRATAIAHAIISSCRPRSFISPLLLSIAVYIHRKYGSRELVDLLSRFNFSDDYREVQRLETTLLSHNRPLDIFSGFTQFVYDNAGFNVPTVTGHNTFHSMGGISCVTLQGTVDEVPVQRTVSVPPVEMVGAFGNVPINAYSKPAVPGLKSVIIRPMKAPEKEPRYVISAKALDRLWIAGYVLELSPCPSWSGFMKVTHQNENSGLADLWETVYAKGSVVHMLTGHAYSRAHRAHMLTSASLICLLLSDNPNCLDNIDKDHLKTLHQMSLQGVHPADVANDVHLLNGIVAQLIIAVANKSRTGKLWVQYLDQVALLHLFIRDERMGNCDLHLHCVEKIIPYFHAAGHLHYAKSARLYLQQMGSLEKVMPSAEYAKFTEQGYFTIRRTDEYWSGNFSDQTIEQVLMRIVKTSGGMTHGRGITDSTLAKWVCAMPGCLHICSQLEEFASVHTSTSEQHKT